MKYPWIVFYNLFFSPYRAPTARNRPTGLQFDTSGPSERIWAGTDRPCESYCRDRQEPRIITASVTVGLVIEEPRAMRLSVQTGKTIMLAFAGVQKMPVLRNVLLLPTFLDAVAKPAP